MALLIGKRAPDFTATVVQQNQIIDNFRLSDNRGKYIVLFFYPLDFTFVCPTELHAFNDKLEDFYARNVQVIGVSVDSAYSHFAWLNTEKSKGGIEGVRYPIVSDIKKEISRQYDVLSENQGIAFRGLFLIDREFIVRHQLINDLPLGRSVDEVLRMVDALQYFEENGEVCPANWKKGQKAMKPTDAGLKEFFS